jgi:hypothetical protein
MNPEAVWRAVYLGLFVLKGLDGVDSKQGFGMAAAVTACIVLVEGWHLKVLDLVNRCEFFVLLLGFETIF